MSYTIPQIEPQMNQHAYKGIMVDVSDCHEVRSAVQYALDQVSYAVAVERTKGSSEDEILTMVEKLAIAWSPSVYDILEIRQPKEIDGDTKGYTGAGFAREGKYLVQMMNITRQGGIPSRGVLTVAQEGQGVFCRVKSEIHLRLIKFLVKRGIE